MTQNRTQDYLIESTPLNKAKIEVGLFMSKIRPEALSEGPLSMQTGLKMRN